MQPHNSYYRPDKLIFTLTTILIGIGIILVYSLAIYTVERFGYSTFHFLYRQLSFGMLSIFIIWFLAHRDPSRWLMPLGFLLFLGGFFLILAMPFLPDNLVKEVGGAKRWINLFGLSLSPVEFFKIGFIYFLAWSFNRKLKHHDNMGIVKEVIRFLPYAALFMVIMLFVAIFQKELGQVAVMGTSLLVMMLFAGSSAGFFFSILGTTLFGFFILIATQGHRIDRITSWWGSVQDYVLQFFPDFISSYLHIEEYKEAYQVNHSLNAIHNGGLFGVGLAEGQLKLGYLGEVHTDFILAGLAEEFGFFGVTVVTLLFLGLITRILQIASKSKDHTEHLFVLGFGLVIAFTFLLNAYGIRGLLPLKGIPVPFLSYGGSSMIATSIGIGMVLMVSRKVKL